MMLVSFYKKIFVKCQKVCGLSVFLLFLFLPTIAFSQVSGGTISGRVLDSAEAVIPGAQITIRNIGTGLTTQLVSNNEGIYRAPNLLPYFYPQV
jgi:hypothetical protein